MPRLNRYETQVSPNIGSSIDAPDRIAPVTIRPIDVPYQPTPNYMGQAIEGLTSAAASLAGNLAQLGEIRQRSADTSWFSKARSQASMEWIRAEQDLQTSWSPGGVGPAPGSPAGGARAAATGPAASSFYDTAQAEWGKIRDRYLAGAPSKDAEAAFTQWADEFAVGSDRSGVGVRAYGFERDQLFAQRASDLNDALADHVQRVAARPDLIDDILAEARSDIAANAFWMTPEEEEKATAEIETQLQLARAKSKATFSPIEFKREIGLGPPTGVDLTAAKIIGAESGGSATADNPNSTALGAGQFIEDTWLALIEKHEPEVWAAYKSGAISREDVLALRTDEKLARDMVVALTSDNAAALEAEGFDASEGNLYIAHFAGVDGAKTLLLADDGEFVANVLGAAVVKANPFLKGKTVGWMKRWAASKMGEAVPADLGSFVDDPHYSRLSPDQIFALAAHADSAILDQHRQAAVIRQQDYDARLNALKLGILDGVAGLPDILKARSDGWLGDADDISGLVKMVETRDKDLIEQTRVLAKGADPNYRWNPFNDDDKKDANTLYKAMGGAIGLSSGDQASVSRLTDHINRTDIIPSDAVDSLRAGMQSRDPAEFKASMSIMDGLYRAYPAAVDRSFTEADVKRLQDWRTLAPILPPDELAQRMDPNQDPARRKLAEDMRQEGAKLAADIDTAEILAAFNTGAFFDYPEGPAEPQQAVALRTDFETLFAERYAVTGNVDAAKDQALERLQLKWGVTGTGRDLRLMAYPPERRYPAVGGDHDWMGDQLEETVAAYLGEATITKPGPDGEVVQARLGPKAQDWGITAAPETEGNWQSENPPYWVWAIDDTGAFRLIVDDAGDPILFHWDYEAARGMALDAFAREQQRALSDMGRVDRIEQLDRTEAQRAFDSAEELRRYEEGMNP